MNTRILLLFAGMVFLSACSATSSLLSFDDAPEPAVAEVPVVAAPAPAATDAWCQRVAASERARAQASGYDAATLDRMTLASFQQCRLIQAQ